MASGAGAGAAVHVDQQALVAAKRELKEEVRRARTRAARARLSPKGSRTRRLCGERPGGCAADDASLLPPLRVGPFFSQLVAKLESKMHAALDQALDTLRAEAQEAAQRAASEANPDSEWRESCPRAADGGSGGRGGHRRTLNPCPCPRRGHRRRACNKKPRRVPCLSPVRRRRRCGGGGAARGF